MITGDENIVQAQAVIQYRISDPKAYLFHVDDPGETDRGIDEGQPDGKTLRDITETTLRQIVGSRNIDDILTSEKEAVQQEVLSKMRELNQLLLDFDIKKTFNAALTNDSFSRRFCNCSFKL